MVELGIEDLESRKSIKRFTSATWGALAFGKRIARLKRYAWAPPLDVIDWRWFGVYRINDGVTRRIWTWFGWEYRFTMPYSVNSFLEFGFSIFWSDGLIHDDGVGQTFGGVASLKYHRYPSLI